ncbi:MAG: ABC transporter ATP-binding protein [Bacteroidetes bacterium]|nr:ABC transporter ATP-binding protein [Bacteroidota bacterium]MCW5894924.1 ABC transporter ATP-binding protein [Bacteroidota bacterium]
MADETIRTTELSKIYKEKSKQPVNALNGLNLSVQRGEIFGLLGRNGAGKTTLLRVLTTLIEPTGGSASVMGFDVRSHGAEVRNRICAVLQENALEQFLSVRDNLTTYARFHSVPAHEREARAQRVLDQFGLTEHRNKKAMDLSGGLKRRLQVAKVFMVDKPIVFLDEATTGMDPINKRAVLESIRKQADEGRTIVLTTHILQEAEELCNTIALIHEGRIIASGSVATIKALATSVFELSITFESMNDELLAQLKSLSPVRFEQTGNLVELCINRVDGTVLDTIAQLSRISPITHLEINGGTLEDAFVELLGVSREDTSWK